MPMGKRKTLLILPLMVAGVMGASVSSCMPSQTNAQNHLMWALNPDDGSYLTADELCTRFSPDSASWGDKIWGRTCIVELPLTDTDTRPKEMVCYVGEGSGSTLTFKFFATADSLPHTIGEVYIEWHENLWGMSDSTMSHIEPDTCFLETRGQGVYTLFNPENQPQREGMLIFVYPGADSLLIHRGSEKTKRVFKVM